jgi:hypothetical protein
MADQVQSLLGWLRRRRRGEEVPAPSEELISPVLKGELVQLAPDLQRAAKRSEALEQLAGKLAAYGAVEPTDAERDELLELVDAARSVIEEIYGHTLTFAWEKDRPESGSQIDGRAYADVVNGKLRGVKIKTMSGGEVYGEATADTVGEGGEATGVEIDELHG